MQLACISRQDIISATVRTMTSREIAELAGKQHKDVLHDIRKMLEDLGLTSADFSADLPDAYGRLQPAFRLPKRECLILISGYSVQMRARIIDRWEALESGAAVPIAAAANPQAPTPQSWWSTAMPHGSARHSRCRSTACSATGRAARLTARWRPAMPSPSAMPHDWSARA